MASLIGCLRVCDGEAICGPALFQVLHYQTEGCFPNFSQAWIFSMNQNAINIYGPVQAGSGVNLGQQSSSIPEAAATAHPQISMSRQTAPALPLYDIYTDELRLPAFDKGLPLYYPEPYDGPVKIADVGFIRKGRFVRLFNAGQEAEHQEDVPKGFKPLDVNKLTWDRPLENDLVPNTYTGRSISATGDDLFRCNSFQGAVLGLEAPTTRQEVRATARIRKYAEDHCLSWYDFAESQDYDVSFGEIMIVTEWSKTVAWNSAVCSSSEAGFSFRAGASVFSRTRTSSDAAGPTPGPVFYRMSKRDEQSTTGSFPTGAASENCGEEPDQTVFIKGCRPGIRELYMSSIARWIMQTIMNWNSGVRDGGVSSERSANFESSGSASSSSQSTHTNWRLTHSLNSSAFTPELPDFNPGVALLTYRMETTNENIIVIDDNEWCDRNNEEILRVIDEYASFFIYGEFLPSTRNDFLGSITAENPRTVHDQQTASSSSAQDGPSRKISDASTSTESASNRGVWMVIREPRSEKAEAEAKQESKNQKTAHDRPVEEDSHEEHSGNIHDVLECNTGVVGRNVDLRRIKFNKSTRNRLNIHHNDGGSMAFRRPWCEDWAKIAEEKTVARLEVAEGKVKVSNSEIEEKNEEISMLRSELWERRTKYKRVSEEMNREICELRLKLSQEIRRHELEALQMKLEIAKLRSELSKERHSRKECEEDLRPKALPGKQPLKIIQSEAEHEQKITAGPRLPEKKNMLE